MRPRVSAATALFFGLLVVSLLIAVLVVRARTPDLVLEVTDGVPGELHPVGPLGPRERTLTFFVRESDDDATVAIVDSEEDIVRTLDQGVALSAGEQVSYSWDGRGDTGELVPAGRYRLLVELPSADREMVWPRRISLGSPPPALGDPGSEAQS